MTAAQLAMHDVQVAGTAALAGIFLGYLVWKLPRQLARINEWWIARTWASARNEAEVRRLHGAFQIEEHVPLTPEQPWWLQRLVDDIQARWAAFKVATAPHSAEQVARDCYLRMQGV